jgi:hypothetical protein
VLTEEEAIAHDSIFMRFEGTVKPRDFLERCFVRDLTDHRVEIQRWRRLKARIIRQASYEKVQSARNAIVSSAREDFRKVREVGAAELADLIKKLQGQPEEIAAKTEKLQAESKENIQAQIDTIEAESIKKFEENERTFSVEESGAALFGKWIENYQLADRCLIAAEKKFRETMRDLEDYRQGLGELLRQADDQIIDGEFEEDVNSTQETQPEVPALRLAAVPPVKELPAVAQAPTTAPVAVAGAGGSNP